jgi:hypothetical protein
MKREGASSLSEYGITQIITDIDPDLVDQKITDPKPESACGRHHAKNKNIGASEMRLFESFKFLSCRSSIR